MLATVNTLKSISSRMSQMTTKLSDKDQDCKFDLVNKTCYGEDHKGRFFVAIGPCTSPIKINNNDSDLLRNLKWKFGSKPYMIIFTQLDKDIPYITQKIMCLESKEDFTVSFMVPEEEIMFIVKTIKTTEKKNII